MLPRQQAVERVLLDVCGDCVQGSVWQIQELKICNCLAHRVVLWMCTELEVRLWFSVRFEKLYGSSVSWMVVRNHSMWSTIRVSYDVRNCCECHCDQKSLVIQTLSIWLYWALAE